MRFPRPPWGERPPPDERVDRPEVEAPRGAREPTGTNGPTLNNHPTNKPGWASKTTVNTLPQPLYKPRSTHTPPNKHGGRVLNTKLVVVIAPGKRPATFRTWKLSPAAPMVLQPPGCGRVGHRHNTLMGSGQKPPGFWPLFLYIELLGSTFSPSGDSHYRCRHRRSLGASWHRVLPVLPEDRRLGYLYLSTGPMPRLGAPSACSCMSTR